MLTAFIFTVKPLLVYRDGLKNMASGIFHPACLEMLQKYSEFPPKLEWGSSAFPLHEGCDPGVNLPILVNLGNLLILVDLNLGVADLNPLLVALHPGADLLILIY